MKASIRTNLEDTAKRQSELNGLLADPKIMKDQNQFRDLSKEYAQLDPVMQQFQSYLTIEADLTEAQLMQKDSDPEMRAMAEEEIKTATKSLDAIELEIQKLLIPVDPHDTANVFLEVRAGAGGDEAAIFAGDIFRMYSRYAEQKGWQFEILSENEGEHGGYREIIARISGKDVYAKLKFESGAHRVQRVPETESQGRIHTSACTVVILAEPDEIEAIEISPSDLRIDTYRASGAGGQHINKTDSAVRITHLPTGMVIECQDERSQHKNRARALSLLNARLLDQATEKQRKEQAETRKSLVGTGDRSDRIRTYNFPQGRVTDHRINLTLYKLEEILQGSLDALVIPLYNEFQAEQLANLGD